MQLRGAHHHARRRRWPVSAPRAGARRLVKVPESGQARRGSRRWSLPDRGTHLRRRRTGPDSRRPDGRAPARAGCHGVTVLVRRDRGALAQLPRRDLRPALARSRDPLEAVHLRRLRRRHGGRDGRPRDRPRGHRRLLDGRGDRPARVEAAPRPGAGPGALLDGPQPPWDQAGAAVLPDAHRGDAPAVALRPGPRRAAGRHASPGSRARPRRSRDLGSGGAAQHQRLVAAGGARRARPVQLRRLDRRGRRTHLRRGDRQGPHDPSAPPAQAGRCDPRRDRAGVRRWPHLPVRQGEGVGAGLPRRPSTTSPPAPPPPRPIPGSPRPTRRESGRVTTRRPRTTRLQHRFGARGPGGTMARL